MHQMFSIYTTPKEFENGASTGHVGFVWNTGSGRKIIGMSTFSKSSGFFFFTLERETNVFKFLRFEERLNSESSVFATDFSAWMVGLTVEIKWRFEISAG